MKYLFIIFISLIGTVSFAQNADYYFHSSAQTYIDGDSRGAKSQLAEGLSKYPNDPKLNELNSKIKDEEQEDKKEQEENQEQEQNEQNQNGEEENQENQEGENQEQEQQDQQEQNQQGDQEEQSEEEKQQQQNQEGEESEEEQEQNQQQQDKEGEESDENSPQNQPPSTADKLKEMNISEEKARMILEALKNNEVQYIQQNRRKSTKPKDKDKPDW